MKKILFCLVLLFVSFSVLPTQAMTTVQKSMGYISVNATETKEIVPDTANVLFSVETTDIDSKRASERNNQITEKVINALKQELLSDKKSLIQTKNYTLRPNYKNSENEIKEIKNYTVSNTIQVKTSDIAKVSSLINIAVKNNVSNISGINFTVEDENIYTSELSNLAIKKAKNFAQDAATTLNQKLAGVKVIRVNVYQQTSNGARLYKTSAGTDSSINSINVPIESGKIKLYASVDAEFYVK